MTANERVRNGFVAGVIAGVLMTVLDLTLLGLGFVEIAYYDWGAALILGFRAVTLAQIAVGQVAHIVFAGVLGIVFAYLIQALSSLNYLLKGWVYGVLVWFSVHVLVNLFGFAMLTPIGVATALSDLATASLYGLVLAEVLHRLSPERVT